MTDIRDVFKHSSQMVDAREVDDRLLEDLDVQQLLVEVTGLVSAELLHISDLSDDPGKNEDMLRGLMVNAANKAFFAGLIIGRETADGIDPGVVVQVPEEVLHALAINTIRDGVMTLTLHSPSESGDQTD